ncbi:hypothetical protein LINPERPRIM_LOCUS24355 [Linum perenne]
MIEKLKKKEKKKNRKRKEKQMLFNFVQVVSPYLASVRLRPRVSVAEVSIVLPLSSQVVR